MASSAHEINFKKGSSIYSPHQELGLIYLLKQGEVSLYHSYNGKREVFDVVGPGTLFGSFSMQPELPSHYAEANRDAVLCAFTVHDFLKVLSSKPDLLARFIQAMSQRLQDYEQRLGNSLLPAKEKIYRELLRLQEKKKEGFLKKLFQIPLRMTHEDIADLTGLNRVTVTRSIKDLKEEGRVVIDSKSGVITVLERTPSEV
ncbi:MAG: Crp/Fnr family transcriptional regulator [Candidatus Altimarinota bacterium]